MVFYEKYVILHGLSIYIKARQGVFVYNNGNTDENCIALPFLIFWFVEKTLLSNMYGIYKNKFIYSIIPTTTHYLKLTPSHMHSQLQNHMVRK
jgi:hypothetical protein